MTLQLSVIIPSHKRPEPLMLCLEDLAAQRGIRRDEFEVILVLQAYPADAAEKIRKKFADRLQLNIAEFEAGLGTSRARNTGGAMTSFRVRCRSSALIPVTG